MLRQTRSMLRLNTAPKTDNKTDNSYAAYFNGIDSYIHIPIDVFDRMGAAQIYCYELLGYWEGGYDRPGNTDWIAGFNYTSKGAIYEERPEAITGCMSARIITGGGAAGKMFIDVYNNAGKYVSTVTTNSAPVNEWFRLIGRVSPVIHTIWVSKFSRSGDRIISSSSIINNNANAGGSFHYTDSFRIGGIKHEEIQESGNFKGYIKSFKMYTKLGTNEYLSDGVDFDTFGKYQKYPARTYIDLDFSDGRMVNRSPIFNNHLDKIILHNVSYRKHPEIKL